MKTDLIRKLNNVKIGIANTILRKRVRRKDFTIISVDCWGSSIYQEMHLPYNTPFVGLFFYPDCYLKLLNELDKYLASNLRFIRESKYSVANEQRRKLANYYPIGVLGEDIEVHFLHYKTEAEARAKWIKRRMRMNMENVFVEFSDHNVLCNSDHILAFDRLKFAHKAVFTAKRYPNIRSSIWMTEFANNSCIPNIYIERHFYKRYFDVADWLNGGNGQPTILVKIINRVLEVEKKWG